MSLRKMRHDLDHSHSANSSQYFKSLPPRQLKPQVPEGLAKRPPTPRPESNFMLLTSKSYISNNGTNRCKPVRKFCIRAIFIAKIPGDPKKELLLCTLVSSLPPASPSPRATSYTTHRAAGITKGHTLKNLAQWGLSRPALAQVSGHWHLSNLI